MKCVHFSHIESGMTGRRQVKKCGVDMHGECAEHEPMMRSGGRAPTGVQGQSHWSRGWAKPPEAENLLAFGAQCKQQICCILRILQTS